MNLLLDTHTVLWFVWDDPQLSAPAKALIVNPANRKLVSLASCWEVAVKVSIGKLNLGESARTFLPRELGKNNFDLLSISLAHATGVEALPFHYRDPFDRLLVSQALEDKLPIVSCDKLFDPYGITRLW